MNIKHIYLFYHFILGVDVYNTDIKYSKHKKFTSRGTLDKIMVNPVQIANVIYLEILNK